MTHAEFLAACPPPAGTPLVPCPGELAEAGRFPDVVLDAAGATRERTVALYRCGGCGAFVAAADGATLNVYWLAEALKPKGG